MTILIHNLPMMFLLLVGHAICDGPLQANGLSGAKRKGGNPELPWWLALPAHSGIHGGAVLIITGRFDLALIETGAHFIIDKLRCTNRIGMLTDQALHVGCKIAWFILAVYFVV
jgi:hypothetical protein